MGRGQVVRHQFLVLAFVGSNPTVPAMVRLAHHFGGTDGPLLRREGCEPAGFGGREAKVKNVFTYSCRASQEGVRSAIGGENAISLLPSQ